MIAALTAGEYAFLMTTLGGVIVSIIISLRGNAKVDVVAAHVNSAATAANAKIQALENEITSLKSERANMRQVAALLAQAEASALAGKKNEPVVVELAPDGPPLPVLVENEPTQPVPIKPAK